MNDIKSMLDSRIDLQQYLYFKSFLITDNEIENKGYPMYDNFNEFKLGKYNFYINKQINLYCYENQGKIYFLVGHAYNPFTMKYDENEILKDIANSTDYQESIDELTGLFLTGYICDDSIHYQVDPSGIQSAYSGIVDEKLYITSHFQLVGDLCELKMTEFVKNLIKDKWYPRLLGPYLPADLSAFEEIKRIVPNNEYVFNGKITHKRFYPLKSFEYAISDEEYDKVISKGSEILKNSMDLISKKWKNPYISLTGGIDSNTTFAAANGNYDKFKAFSYLSAEKESIDVDAAKIIANKFNVNHKIFNISNNNDDYKDFQEITSIIKHNNGYVSDNSDHEYRKRLHLIENFKGDVEVKSWVSETIRAYWYKYYGRKKMPKLSPKLFRNFYKVFIFNRTLAHKIDKIYANYIDEYGYNDIPESYDISDINYAEIGWGSWGGVNISEMRIYSEITSIYNNRKFLELLLHIPLDDRINDTHHLAMKKILNRELYEMNIRVKNMKETKLRAFLLNVLFTINMILPF